MTASQRPAAHLIGHVVQHITHSISAEKRSQSGLEWRTCPECGAPTRYSWGFSESRKGGNNGYAEYCTACGYADGDGDAYTNEDAAYEDYCDAMHRMTTSPAQEYHDSLCHRCEQVPAEPGSITCWKCSVELHGEAKAEEMRKQRELRLNPPLYVPVAN